MLDIILVRGMFILVLAAAGYHLQPFGQPQWIAGLGGAVLGGLIIFFEIRLEQVSLKRLIGAACGVGAGNLRRLPDVAGARAEPHADPFLQVCLLLWMTYVGLIVGAKKGDMLNLAALGGIFGGEKVVQEDASRFWIPA